MKTLMAICLIIFSFSSFAGSTGYIFEGKTYFLFKDGIELNETPMTNSIGREPASLGINAPSKDSMILYFTEDDVARCYFWAPKKVDPSERASKNIHCMPKSKL
jgi:hypothetical protein